MSDTKGKTQKTPVHTTICCYHVCGSKEPHFWLKERWEGRWRERREESMVGGMVEARMEQRKPVKMPARQRLSGWREMGVVSGGGFVLEHEGVRGEERRAERGRWREEEEGWGGGEERRRRRRRRKRRKRSGRGRRGGEDDDKHKEGEDEREPRQRTTSQTPMRQAKSSTHQANNTFANKGYSQSCHNTVLG